MNETEAVKAILKTYAETSNPVTQEFYQALCTRALEAIEELQAENERLRALCLRESKVLCGALKLYNNKSMIAVVADSLRKQAPKDTK